MAVGDVFRLLRYWQRNPPHGDFLALLARFIGWKRPEPESEQLPASFEDAVREHDWSEKPERFFARAPSPGAATK